MTTSITMRNFRVFTEECVDLTGKKIVKLLGANRAGKSTVREALCFAFTGRDSSGGTAPTHLIRKGEKKATVDVTTPTFRIERSLTLKKESNIKLYRDGFVVGISVNQTGLMEMLGLSEDMILATMIPGYFMRLSKDKRLKLFSSMTKEINRNQLVADMTGLSVTWIKRYAGDLIEKIPPVSTVAQARLSCEKRLNTLEGKVSVHEDLLRETLQEPRLSHEDSELIKKVEKYLSDRNSYSEKLLQYSTALSYRESVIRDNLKKEALRAEILERLAQIHHVVVPNEPDWGPYHKIQKELLPYPKKPELNLVSGDFCPTCGQPTSIAYKDKVSQNYKAELSAYGEEVTRIETYNKKIMVEMDRLYKELTEESRCYLSAVKHNESYEENRKLLESQLMSCTPSPLPPEVPAPSLPKEPFSKEVIERAQTLKKEYDKDMGYYLKVRDKKILYDTTISSILEEIESKKATISDLEKLEAAIKELPQKEASLKQSLMDLNLDGVSVSTEDGFIIQDDMGVPYECMSSGQALRVDVAISCKLYEFLLDLNHSAALKFYPMMFVDNTDLADWSGKISFPDFLGCVLYAYVEPESLFRVEV